MTTMIMLIIIIIIMIIIIIITSGQIIRHKGLIDSSSLRSNYCSVV